MPTFVPNLRDVGGLTADDGTAVVSGRVLRSAAPAPEDLVPDGVAWPPSVVIDLRSVGEWEWEKVHPLASSGARIVNLPLLAALRPDAAPSESLHGLYLVLLDHASMYLVQLVREVGTAEGAILIHCAAGKDRTGIAIALLLRLLGVSREQIVDDYRETERAEAEILARIRRRPGGRWRRTVPAHFLVVSVEAIEAVLDVWDAHEGGVRGWFHSAGGDDDMIDQLRRTLTA